MYINSYKYISSDNLELPHLVNNSFDQISSIEEIKNSLKRSAEEFEAKQLLKKIKLVLSTHVSNLSYPTDTLTNDISYIEQVKNSSSNTNEVSDIIDKKIEFFHLQKSSIKDEKFEKIIEELFPYQLSNKEMIIESKICEPVVLFSNINQETHLQSPPSTDIISLASSMAVLSSNNNLESEGKESTISSNLTNDISSSNPTWEINQKIPKARKRNSADPEIRKRMSEASKRNWADPEYREKMSEAMKRNFADPEIRKKISEARKRNWADPEYREKMSEARKRKRADPEYRGKISKARKRKRADPEYRGKISKARKRNSAHSTN